MEISIREVQEMLNQAGYHVGDPSGVMDERTIQSLKEFQAAYGLDQTGEVDRVTKVYLRQATHWPETDYTVTIPWLDEMTAFTLRRIYPQAMIEVNKQNVASS